MHMHLRLYIHKTHACTHTHAPVLSCPVLLYNCHYMATFHPSGGTKLNALSLECHDPGLHVWTARSPLLKNHLLQTIHWAAPRCSRTGFSLSLLHLCRFLSLPRLYFLEHTSQVTSHVSTDSWSAALSSTLLSRPNLHVALHPALDAVASSYTFTFIQLDSLQIPRNHVPPSSPRATTQTWLGQ